MVAWVPFLLTFGPFAGFICCCCCCFYNFKKEWALWMQLPQPVLNELGIEDVNVVKITLPKLGSSPGDTFKAQARDGRIAEFKLVSLSENTREDMIYDWKWGWIKEPAPRAAAPPPANKAKVTPGANNVRSNFCGQCGTAIPITGAFCPQCGAAGYSA